MGKLSALCFSLLALAIIAGELTAVLSQVTESCYDILPWLKSHCRKDGAPTPECLGNCTQRHPKLLSAFCNNQLPKGACVCEYPGPCIHHGHHLQISSGN